MIGGSSSRGREVRRPRLLFLVLLLSSFFGPFGGRLILPMFRAMKLDFQVEVLLLGLSITVFMAPFSGVQLFSGLLSELYLDRRTLITGGFLLYALSSLLAAIAPSIWPFLAARVAQGVGAALVVPLTLALVGEVYRGEVRGRVMGGMAVAMMLGATLGPLLGGYVAPVSWRLGFLVLAATTLGTALLARIAIPSKAPEARSSGDVGLALRHLWSTLIRRGVALVSLLGFILFFAQISINTYLADVLTLPPYAVGEEAIGSFLALGGLGGLMAGPVAGYLTDRLGRRATALIGILATLATLSLYLTPLWFTHLALILPLLGFTLTSAFTPLNTLAVEVAPKARATATSIYGSASFLGFTLAPIIAYPFYTWATIQGVAALAMAFIAAGIVVLAAIPPSEG